MSTAASATVPATSADPRWAAVFARLMVTEGGALTGGGFTDDPNDAGGATKYGLSLRFLAAEGRLDPKLLAEFDIDHTGDLSVADIQAMTESEAEDAYYQCFWLSTGFSTLPQPFDAAVFDQGVNGGVATGVKLLQSALNSVFRTSLGLEPLTIDGGLGLQTRTRLTTGIANKGADAVLAAYRSAAATRYTAIVARDPTQREFIAGWLRRAEELGDV